MAGEENITRESVPDKDFATRYKEAFAHIKAHPLEDHEALIESFRGLPITSILAIKNLRDAWIVYRQWAEEAKLALQNTVQPFTFTAQIHEGMDGAPRDREVLAWFPHMADYKKHQPWRIFIFDKDKWTGYPELFSHWCELPQRMDEK